VLGACLAIACACCLILAACLAPSAGAYTAYVSNVTGGTLSPINTLTNHVGSPINVNDPPFLAITPDGSTAWVTDANQGTVTPVTLSSGITGTPIAVGTNPYGIAITPDGTKAYVANHGSESVTPINLITKTAGSPIKVGKEPYAIAINPEGTKAYVTNYGSNSVTPITISSNTAGTSISVGNGPKSIAITPDGTTAWVASTNANTIEPITLSSGTTGTSIAVQEPNSLAITPDGSTAYVTDATHNEVTPVNLTSKTAGTPIGVGDLPYQVAITPDGSTAYVTNAESDSVTPINLTTKAPGAEITAGEVPDGIAITPDQAPHASFAVTPASAGSPTSFNASASTVAYGTITSYAWKFGDGATATTSTPTTTHTYAAEGSYTATLTETDSAGTSTTQVFTGQTVSRNGGSSAQTTRSVSIPPAPPANTALPSITGTAKQGQTLTEAHGTWTNSPSAYAYQWLRCNAAGEACSAISGATGQTYALVADDVGHTLRVQETASNAGGSSSPAKSPLTGVIGALPEQSSNLLPSNEPLSFLPDQVDPTRPVDPLVTISSLTINASGVGVIPLQCPLSATGGCRGRVTLTAQIAPTHALRASAARCARGCRSLGSATYEARAGQKISVRVHIASYGRRILRNKASLRATLTVSANAGGQSKTVSRTIRLHGSARTGRRR
jgi:YVTN family beta-propeller protein